MVFRPEVFVSVTPGELDPYRDVVKATLREMGAHPVEHTDLSTTYGPLDGILKVAIGRCDVVVHVTGFAFGPEPADRTHGAPRRSFSHYEYDVAKALKREVLSFLARPGTPVSAADRGNEDAHRLQADHRRTIERQGEHWTFGGLDELAELIRSLRPRIMVRRRYVRLPFPPRAQQLFGRERLIDEVQEALAKPGIVLIEPPAQFATSSASAGKTALAVEAAWRMYENGRYDFVFYVPAGSGAEIEGELASHSHADALALVKDEVAGHRVRVHAVRKWLRADVNAGRFLVILDAVDHETTWLAVESMLPWFERGSVIITTRQPRPIVGATHISVGAIPRDAAVSLLATRLYGREANAGEEQALEQMAGLLGYQPFALQLAARHMADSRENLQQLFAALSMAEEKGIQEKVPRVSRWMPVVAKLVRRTMGRLDGTERGLLNVFTCLAPQPSAIPQAVFSARSDPTQTRTALAHLEKLGLINFADDGNSILVPRLVREVVLDRLSPEEISVALDMARALVEGAIDRAGNAGGSAVVRTRLVTHCRVLLGQLNGHPFEYRAGGLARTVASWLRDCGRLSAAENFQRRALNIAEKVYQPGHPELVPELRSLAGILQDGRRFTEAVKYHRRAIAILEKHSAGRGNELIQELFSLAACLRADGKLKDAEPILRRALEIEERASGRSHARTAIAAHTLASLLEVMHRPADAVPLYRRALEIDEQLPHCPPARLASRLHHLATAMAATGLRPEAIALHQRALAYDEQAYGSRHLELVPALKQLAGLFELEGRHAEAVALLRRALTIEDGAENIPPTEIASTLTSLAAVLSREGHASEIEPLCRRALTLLDDASNWHPLARALRWECETLLGQ